MGSATAGKLGHDESDRDKRGGAQYVCHDDFSPACRFETCSLKNSVRQAVIISTTDSQAPGLPPGVLPQLTGCPFTWMTPLS
jgi:hypothetical protein